MGNTTNWITIHMTRTVEWPDRVDELTFALGPDSQTRVTLVHDGKTTVKVK